MPYGKRLVFITAKVIIETVAKVAAAGSSPTNGTTNASIDAAGQNAREEMQAITRLLDGHQPVKIKISRSYG